MVDLNNDFKQIGMMAQTDKVTHHGYDRFYPQELQNFRFDEFAMLEIGIQFGESLTLWSQYFPNAFIYGIDINVEHQDERSKIFKCDQSDIYQLMNVKQSIDTDLPIKFINDDGSHIPEHQILTFDYFFSELLCDGGVYIIEDIETSYWKRSDCYGYPTNYGWLHPDSLIEQFKTLTDYINIEYLNDSDKQLLEEKTSFLSKQTKEAISSIRFVQNCIVIQKKNKEDYIYNNRKYRFPEKL